MMNPQITQRIMGVVIEIIDEIKHGSVQYMNDETDAIGGKTVEKVKKYTDQFLEVLSKCMNTID